MGYKINFEGLEVTCETPEDLIALAQASKRRNTTSEAASKPVKQARQNGHTGKLSLKEVLKPLNDRAINMLKTVLGSPDATISSRDLASVLGLESGSSLGGIRGSFSKHLMLNGYAPEHYLEVTGDPGNKTYSIPLDKIDELQSALGW